MPYITQTERKEMEQAIEVPADGRETLVQLMGTAQSSKVRFWPKTLHIWDPARGTDGLGAALKGRMADGPIGSQSPPFLANPNARCHSFHARLVWSAVCARQDG